MQLDCYELHDGAWLAIHPASGIYEVAETNEDAKAAVEAEIAPRAAPADGATADPALGDALADGGGEADVRRADLFQCPECGATYFNRLPDQRECAACGAEELLYHGEIDYQDMTLGDG